jgi:chromosomal replication initiation ATPase DnaA
VTLDEIAAELAVRDLLELVDEVCRARRITREELCGRGRTKAVASARRELWWRLRHHQELSFSYEEIGRLFDRDHATVISGVRAHERSRGAVEPSPSAREARTEPDTDCEPEPAG